ncbi:MULTISPECIES: GNAT family N-acetyltransferase [Parageobacillus]|jgi:predicted GNAT family N-acyltransferase|uniref:Acetyltransferase n=1 Tax=Parageobacillus thermoglucosidasius TaxID=1426 RepID=A0A1B7KPC6_PARTM|nr:MULTISPECIES: GNAT family N-acetyltransferase [Parageobacillus]OAT71922.1 acetyltransferase [Parageobacillus thermoglucosidasius]BDG48349.1 N-acetyltransferase [Parageobacillus sp. KH3-4]
MNVAIGGKNDTPLYKDALLVRRIVFIEEQHVPEEEEIDEFEQEATHFVLYDGEKPVGAGRLRTIDDGVGKIERICVLPQYRGRGAGKQLMEMIEMFAKEQGIRKVKLNAQTHAEPFYQKLGYHTVSDVFMDAGIPHVTMVKSLL